MLQDKYINPLTDYGFKKLFGTEPNKALLIDFLNQILPEKHLIEDLSYTSNEHLGDNELDRKAIFDLYCTTKSGERFIVEIQKSKQNYFKDRSVYYSTFPIREQAKKGDWDFKLDAIYTIGILDFVFEDDKDNPDYFHNVQLKNQRNEVFFDKLSYIYIELPKFVKEEKDLENTFEKWLYVFRHLSKLTSRPKSLQGRIFEHLFSVAEIAKFNSDEFAKYEGSLKHFRDLNNVSATAKDEGRKEGLVLGEKIGLEKGLEKGKEIGILEGVKSIAKKMKDEGMSFKMIKSISGLTEEEIKGL